MDIHVGLPSRNRPHDLAASVISLFRLSSGTNNVTVTVAADADDGRTTDVAVALGRDYPVSVSISARPFGLGEIHNRLAALTPADGAFMLWSDRIMAITPNWDHELAQACMQYPNRPLWMDSLHLAGAGQFILPAVWREAQGDPCPGLFPFWFEDTAVEEIEAYAHGYPRIALASKAAGPRGQKTTRCRDIPFWIALFAVQRPLRVQQAAEICRKLDLPTRDSSAMVAHFTERDRQMLARAGELQAVYGAEGEPDESYLRARARARAVLEELCPAAREAAE